MNTPIHVLLVEDAPDDATLIVDALREGSFIVDAKRVETAAAMRDALSDRLWDVILCDFTLPQFNGEAAMALAAELAPDVPLIVVTGTIGEERLANAMRAGARDFVLKEKLGRLVPAVTRELASAKDATERRRLEQELRREQQRYRALVEKSNDAVSILDRDGSVVYGSSSSQRILGYEAAELVGHSAFEFVDASEIASLEKDFAALSADPNRVLHRELRCVRKDGKLRWVEIAAANRLEDPDIRGLVVNYHDVTDRKQAEEERRKDVHRTQALLDLLQNPHQPPSEIIDNAVNQVVAMTGSEYGFIGVVDATQSVMTCHLSLEAIARCQMAGDGPIEFSVAPGGLWSVAIKEQQVVVLNNYEAPNPWKKGFPAGHLDLRRFIGVPVVRNGKTVLVCALANKPEPYDDSDVMHIRLFLEGVCGALENNRKDEALRRNEKYYRALTERSVDLVAVLRADGVIAYDSPSVERILGWRPHELVGRNAFEFVHPDDRDRLRALMASQAMRHGNIDTVEFKYAHRDGRWRVLEANARNLLRDPDIAGIVVNARDITLRVEAVEEAQRNQQRWQARRDLQFDLTRVLSESAAIGETTPRILECLCRKRDWMFGAFWMLDRGTKTLRCTTAWHRENQALASIAETRRMLSLPQGTGFAGVVWANARATWLAPIDPATLHLKPATIAQLGVQGAIGIPVVTRNEIVGVIECFSADAAAPDEDSMVVFGTLGDQIGQFIERKQLEEQFRQAQKMEALGTLAGGIAHDFNNILAAITGYAELAKLQLSGNEKAAEHLDGVLAGTRRAIELVRQILAFSRRQPQQRKPIQLRAVAEEALKMLRAMIPPTIEFDVRLASDTSTVLADSTQVHQVLMNLGANAAHAMRDRPGRLSVVLENVTVAPGGAEAPTDPRPGKYVRLSVADTGCGMDEATLARIFEPFFTTKALGEGTGLGLSVVHGIMRNHEGAVTVRSRPGEGSVFELYFPAIDVEEIEHKTTAADVPHGHGERILYIDDEQPLAELGAKVLIRLGYSVDARTNPEEALAALCEDPGRYDLVVTDQMMPRLIGTDLAKQVRAIRPDLPVLLVTGYTAALTPDDLRRAGVRKTLLKPMSVEALARAVQAVLARR